MTTTNIADVLRKARAATLLARVRERGTISVDAALLTAWAASGWTLNQITTAAHDLMDEGVVRMTTKGEAHTITWAGGGR